MPPLLIDEHGFLLPAIPRYVIDNISIRTGCSFEHSVALIDRMRDQTDRIVSRRQPLDGSEEEALRLMSVAQVVASVTSPILDVMKVATVTICCGQEQLKNTLVEKLDRMDAKIDAVNQKLDNLKTAVDKSEKEILSEVHSVEAGLAARIRSYEEDFNLLNADIGVRLKYEDTESKKDRDDNQRATATIVTALNVLLRNTRHDEMVIPIYHKVGIPPPVGEMQRVRAQKRRAIFGEMDGLTAALLYNTLDGPIPHATE